MHELSTTTYGRLLSVAILIALVGGSVGSTLHDATGVAVMCSSLILGLGLAFVAIGLALESDLAFAFKGVIALPGLFFLYVVGIGVASYNHAHWMAYAFSAIGILIGLNGLRGHLAAPTFRAPRPAPAH